MSLRVHFLTCSLLGFKWYLRSNSINVLNKALPSLTSDHTLQTIFSHQKHLLFPTFPTRINYFLSFSPSADEGQWPQSLKALILVSHLGPTVSVSA